VRRLFLIATAAGTLAICSTALRAVTPPDLSASAATVALFAWRHTIVAATTGAIAPITTASPTPIAMASATATTVATVTTAATTPTTLTTTATAGATPSATPLTAGLAPPTATKTAAAQPTATPTTPPSSTLTSVAIMTSTPTVTTSPPLLSPTQTTMAASPTPMAPVATTTTATTPTTAAITPTTTAATTTTVTAAAIIDTAKQYLGYHYANIGDEPSTGFSCIGLIHYVFARHGLYVPGNLETAYASAPHVDQSNLQPGDIVFFQNTVWSGLSHAALYVGNGRMIAADSFQTGVRWDMLSDPYWQEHYLGATRPLSNPSGTLLYPVPTPAADDPFATPTPDNGPTIVIEAGTRLSPRRTATLYSGPGASYDSIDTVPRGTSLTVVQTQGQWVNVSYADGNSFGWVRGTDLALPPGHVGHVYSAHSAQHGHSSRNTRRHSAPSQPVHSHGHGNSSATHTTRTAGLGRHRTAPASHVTRHRTAPASHVTRHPRSSTTSTWHRASPHRPTQAHHTSHASTQRRHAVHVSTTGRSHHGSATHAATSNQRHVTQHAAHPHAGPGYHVLTVTADVLFVRSAPSTHARILRRVFVGDHLRLLATHNGWDYVALRSGARGWVSAHWVR